MPRLFTGLEVPDELASQLSLLQGGLHGARWIERRDFHVTLRFIGDVDHGLARELVSALDGVKRGPIALTIDGLGAFGGNTPHTLFARIVPNDDLTALQRQHERIAQTLGLKRERHAFVPHITLARCKGLAPGAVAHWLSMRATVMKLTFEAERFVLYSARDSVGGGPYVVEEDYPLVA